MRDELRQALREADALGSLPFRPAEGRFEPASPRTIATMQGQGNDNADAILL